MFFYILIICLLDTVLILLGEILSWSLLGVKGLRTMLCFTRFYLEEDVTLILICFYFLGSQFCVEYLFKHEE